MSSSSPELTKPKLLLVDGASGFRSNVAAILKGLDFEVIEASQGIEAIEIIKADSAIRSLLVENYLPPGFEGEELVKQVFLDFGCEDISTTLWTPNGVVADKLRIVFASWEINASVCVKTRDPEEISKIVGTNLRR